jgi:uncharacterized protein (TIGR02145 family)
VQEWDTLIARLGGSSVAGGKMKSTDKWLAPNTGATNESHFSAIPGGSRYHSDGPFNNLGDHACFWSSSVYDEKTGWFFLSTMTETEHIRTDSEIQADSVSGVCRTNNSIRPLLWVRK